MVPSLSMSAVPAADALAISSWALQQKIASPALQHVRVDGLRGIVASVDIPAGEPLVQLPASAMLVQPDGSGPWWVRLASLLTQDHPEKAQYMQYLEESECTVPLQWPAPCVDALCYPYMQQQIKGQRRLFRIHHTLSGPPGCSLQRFSWALTQVLSRAYQLPPTQGTSTSSVDDGIMALLPVVDSINHHSSILTDMYWNEVKGSLLLLYTKHSALL